MCCFFFNAPAPPEIYTLSLHDALPILGRVAHGGVSMEARASAARAIGILRGRGAVPDLVAALRSKDSQVIYERSEEHTSELQSHVNLVCRLLLEKKKKKKRKMYTRRIQ